MTKRTALLGASLLSLSCSPSGGGTPSPATSEPEPSHTTTTTDVSSAADSNDSSGLPVTPPPPAPPADAKPRVHFAITVNAGCDIPAGTYYYPARSDEPVSGTSAGVGFADGELGDDDRPVTVECNWSNEAAPYSVGINLLAGPITEQLYLAANMPLDPATEQEGVLLLSGAPVPNEQTYGPAGGKLCSFKVKELDAESGSAWGELACEALGPQEGQTSCVIGTSYFALENCKP